MNYIEESKVIFKTDRPKTFMDNPIHCDECEQVERNAQVADIDTLTLKKAGEGYASFSCFLNNVGFIYYLPAFIRLCIETTMDDGYLDGLIFGITIDGRHNSRLKFCTKEQRAFMCQFLEWYRDNHPEIILQWMVDDKEINEAIVLWSEFEQA